MNEALKQKLSKLPASPGVYFHKNKAGEIIYVGKAKSLRKRVSSYFVQSKEHSAKVRVLVRQIEAIKHIVVNSEQDALLLENSLIKTHQPRYNILLKDDKGYPYVRLDTKALYPKFSMVNRLSDDNAAYFGPYGSRGTTNAILETLQTTLKLPGCRKLFPRDIGKDRPCLNYHMGQCDGWCQQGRTREDYLQRIEQARQLLSGNYKKVAQDIRNQMLCAADNMEFELAAGLRDGLSAVEALSKKQLVTAGTMADMDVIGYGQTETKACFAVLHYRDGNLLDKDYEIIATPDDPEVAVSALMKQYYLSRGIAPKIVLLPFAVEDSELFAMLMEQRSGRRVRLHVPQRGDNVRLVELAVKNAQEEALRLTGKEERISGTLQLLGKMLAMEPPKRMESFDISNISGTDMVGSMVVFEDGKPKKSEYKRFKIEDLPGQNDYAAMRQVIFRRFSHFKNGDKGFDRKPDLLLIDGGITHAAAATAVLSEMELNIRTVGMVKDDRHRTRAIALPGGEIAIHRKRAAFTLLANIQEEVHRSAIRYHRQRRKGSSLATTLTEIEGIGATRAKALLRQFGSLRGVQNASLEELLLVKGMTRPAAEAIQRYFQSKG